LYRFSFPAIEQEEEDRLRLEAALLFSCQQADENTKINFSLPRQSAAKQNSAPSRVVVCFFYLLMFHMVVIG